MDICSRNKKLTIRRPAILVALALLLCSCKSTPPESMVTPPAGSKPPATTQQSSQPMRGIWLATVSRLDWPPVSSVNNSNPTSRARVQQQAMIDKLDHLQRLGINTVFFQVKPDGTALWPSKILPWSDLMTGKIGENPGYDPLQFMLDEAHKRGMKVYNKFVIDCDRHNRLHFSFFCYLAYSHVCNVHKLLCPFHPIIRWRIFRFFRQQF